MPRRSAAAFKRKNAKRRRAIGKVKEWERKGENLRTKPFIAWDGEGYDDEIGQHHYMLFGASTGQYIKGESLNTVDCLQLMIDIEKENLDAIHIGFAFEYDVNMILKDLKWRYLGVLYDTGTVVWQGFTISHTPHKLFSVSKGGVRATIYDVFGFFHSSYVKALEKYGVGDEETLNRIREGKARRGKFRMEDMPDIVKYWASELRLMPELMEHIRTAAFGGGFYISEWHGPGALAAYALKVNGMNKMHSRNLKPDVKSAIQFAYAGGRFQQFLCGEYDGPVYTADINSAYIYACALLPRLDRGKWVRRDPASIKSSADITRFALYKVQFDASSKYDLREYARKGVPLPPMPFFHRAKDGTLTWPTKTIGWYWSPEVRAALDSMPEFVKIKEVIEFKDDGTYPFAWVNQAYQRRVKLQHEGNPAEKAYKWALAAMYGAFARRVGWDQKTRKAPASHELAWAGFITSYCRSMVYRVAMRQSPFLVSIDTDGVTSLRPFDFPLENGIGEDLGQWKLEEYTGILQWQSGIYWLRTADEWSGAKTRGIQRGSLNYESAIEAYRNADFLSRPPVHPFIRTTGKRFIGYRMALRGRFKEWRRWVDHELKVVLGGQGKGKHVPQFCRHCAGMTDFIPMHTVSLIPPDNPISVVHKLPWLVQATEQPKNIIGDFIWEDD